MLSLYADLISFSIALGYLGKVHRHKSGIIVVEHTASFLVIISVTEDSNVGGDKKRNDGHNHNFSRKVRGLGHRSEW